MSLPPKFGMIPRLYHFTDRRNIAAIHSIGGLLATAHLKQTGIPFRAGGNPLSLELDSCGGMDRYVHLCFLQKHPMQYVASNDGRIGETQWIRISRSVLTLPGVLFCLGVSNANNANPVPIESASELLDFEALYHYLDWSVPELYERRRLAELSEILVPDFISIDYLENLPNG